MQGPGSNEVKFDQVLCAPCNNARSQPFDVAYDLFAAFIARNEDSILRRRGFRFSEIYGQAWRSAKENLARYYVKHIGCRLAQSGIEVAPSITDYLDGRATVLTGLEMQFEIWGDLVALAEHIRRHGDDFAGGLSMGDLLCMYSPSTGNITEIQGFLSYRWLRLNYLCDSRIHRPRGSFRRNRVKLSYGLSIDPSTFERDGENAGQREVSPRAECRGRVLHPNSCLKLILNSRGGPSFY